MHQPQPLAVSGSDFRLGDPPVVAHTADAEGRVVYLGQAPAVEPDEDPLVDALRDLTAAVRTLTLILNQPPWYARLWARVRSLWS